MAGFPKNNHDPFSRPTCSQTFEWSTDAYILEFSAGFALMGRDQGNHMAGERKLCSVNVYFPLTFESVLLQDFKRVDGSAVQPDQDCPIEPNLPRARNPYYIPKSTSSLDGADQAANDPLASLAMSFASNQLGAGGSGTTDTPPVSDFGSLIEASPSPVELSAISGPNLLPVGFDGGDCTGDGCRVTPFAPLDNLINVKRGSPVAFRA